MKIIKTLLYIILGAALVLGAYFSWQFYTKAKAPVLDALYILPNDAAIVFGFNDYEKFNTQLGMENLIWHDIKLTNQMDIKKQAVDSILNDLSKETHFQDLLSSPLSKLYVSYHFAGRNRFEIVYSFSFPQVIDDRDIKKYLEDRYQVKTREFDQEVIHEVSVKGSKETYYISSLGGVICITSYAPLAEKIIYSAHAADPEKQDLKSRMLKMSGKDIAANVYVNYRYLYRLLSQYTASKYKPFLMSLGELSQAADFDLNVQEDRINFSGFSIQNDSFPSYLATLQGYDPVIVEATHIVPAHASFMYYQGANNLSGLLKSRAEGPFSERDEALLQRYKARLLVDVGDYFYPWIKDEVVFAYAKSPSLDAKDGGYAILEATDIKEADQMLSKLAHTAADQKGIVYDTMQHNYRSYPMYTIALGHLLPALFGEMFGSLENTHYTYIDTYVVFANSEAALQSIIDNYLIERVLNNCDVYKNVLEDISDETSVLLYINLQYLGSQVKEFLSSEGLDLIQQSGLAYENIGTLALQYITSDQDVYTSLVIHHSKQKVLDEPIAWKTALDNPVARGPFKIKNHRTNKQEILVFDKSKLMYRIDHNGAIAWTVPVTEYPMSEVYMIDYYKNGKYQYIFNSKNYLYIYDLNGNRVENYPVKLPLEAVGPMSLVDYDKQKSYRILIPLSDGKVYNFQIDGNQTPGWKFPTMKEPIRQKVQFFRLGNKDFLVVSDTAGNVIYANRRGEARMDAQLAFTNNPRTTFFKKSGNEHPKIITTDLLGRVISLDAAGKVDKLLLQEFSPHHSFSYFDFNGDKRKDYIYLDHNVLYVFNHRNKMILKRDFDFPLSPEIMSVKMNTKDTIRLVLHSSDNQQLILVSQSGRILENRDYKSNRNFIKEEATKSDILRLIGTNGRIVSSFLIK